MMVKCPRILFFQEESGRYVLHFALNHIFFFTKITDQDLLSVYIVIPMLEYGFVIDQNKLGLLLNHATSLPSV